MKIEIGERETIKSKELSEYHYVVGKLGYDLVIAQKQRGKSQFQFNWVFRDITIEGLTHTTVKGFDTLQALVEHYSSRGNVFQAFETSKEALQWCTDNAEESL